MASMQQQQQSVKYGLREVKHNSKNLNNNKKKPKNGHQSPSSNPYLSTEVTNLDMNVMFTQNREQQKKLNGLKRRPQQSHEQLTNAAAQYLAQQNYGLSSYYPPPHSFYSGFDHQNFNDFIGSDLPSLMSVAPYKHNVQDAFDMSQFSEDLLAVNNNNFASRLTGAGDLQANGYADVQSKFGMPVNTVSRRPNGSARKNRMVEVKTIDDGRSVVVVSDPLAATVANRSTVVQLGSSRVSGSHARTFEPILSAEPVYSRKVFIGGLPIDVTEEEVWATFGTFGKVLVDWPRRPEHGKVDYLDAEMQGRRNSRSVSGYVFLVFQHEQSVQQLVNSCEIFDNKYYLELSSPTMTDKAVQVRAWRLSDIDYFVNDYDSQSIDHRRTVFIGGVPRPTRACDLAVCLEKYYGKVSYVGIDIDPELKYPKGAARVTFATAKSFVSAISGRFVHVVHSDTNKRVEIKPYVMEDQICDECEGKLCKHSYAPYYCGDPSCLQYYCEVCWDRLHYTVSTSRAEHRPMVRTGDQTKLLPRPPHHPQSNMAFNRSMNHTHVHPEQTSMIARVASGRLSNISKPFAANPTCIGY